ncbi:methylated-DNA-protein-cysteine S-methyltransferase [Streptomyces sp. Mg1]|nr:methylated-DNA-protein-cysteine S-methyltransferase [Streptomyces sp. Mg1]
MGHRRPPHQPPARLRSTTRHEQQAAHRRRQPLRPAHPGRLGRRPQRPLHDRPAPPSRRGVLRRARPGRRGAVPGRGGAADRVLRRRAHRVHRPRPAGGHGVPAQRVGAAGAHPVRPDLVVRGTRRPARQAERLARGGPGQRERTRSASSSPATA